MVNDALVRHDGPELSLDRFRSAVFGKLTHRKHSPEPETGNSLRILPGADGANPFSSFRYLPSLEEADAALVAEALHRSGGNQTAAARTLGISRQALNNRLRRARTELDTGRFVRSNIS